MVKASLIYWFGLLCGVLDLIVENTSRILKGKEPTSTSAYMRWFELSLKHEDLIIENKHVLILCIFKKAFTQISTYMIHTNEIKNSDSSGQTWHQVAWWAYVFILCYYYIINWNWSFIVANTMAYGLQCSI